MVWQRAQSSFYIKQTHSRALKSVCDGYTERDGCQLAVSKTVDASFDDLPVNEDDSGCARADRIVFL